MKYPIDILTAEQLFGHLISHHRAQEAAIKRLTDILMDAMTDDDTDVDATWYRDAKAFIKAQKELKMYHETRIFNEKNGRGSAEPANTEIVQRATELANNVHFTPEMNARANDAEKGFGEELSEEELAKMFGEKPKKKKKGEVDISAAKPFEGMTLEQIEKWEADQNNSNDIYKVKARVANNARGSSGGNLTPVGEIMCNTFVHMLLDLYKYADTLPAEQKIPLVERVRKHENVPGQIIVASTAQVRVKK